MKRITALSCAALLFAPAAFAIITFTQLDDDVFVVSHRIKTIGSRARAMKLVHEKAASLCVAAGYTHYEVLEQESEAAQEDDAANASVQVRLFQQDGDGRIDCERNADVKYVDQAREKLARRGYQPPEPPGEEPATGRTVESASCTVEQIAAMVRAGLSDEQIKAACPPES